MIARCEVVNTYHRRATAGRAPRLVATAAREVTDATSPRRGEVSTGPGKSNGGQVAKVATWTAALFPEHFPALFIIASYGCYLALCGASGVVAPGPQLDEARTHAMEMVVGRNLSLIIRSVVLSLILFCASFPITPEDSEGGSNVRRQPDSHTRWFSLSVVLRGAMAFDGAS
jgi:hypothetical protein